MPDISVVDNSRRILILSNPKADVLSFVKELTGSAPAPRVVETSSLPQEHATTEPLLKATPTHARHETSSPGPQSTETRKQASTPPQPRDINPPPNTTTAGLTHILSLHTKYYKADIPIWLDETATPAEWATDFCSEEARDVVKAVGAWIVLFTLNTIHDRDGDGGDGETRREEVAGYLNAVKETIRTTYAEDEDHEGVLLAVGWPPSEVSPNRSANIDGKEEVDAQDTELWEDLCFDHGFEFVDGRKRAAGERTAMGELQGMERVQEALEANEWEGVGNLGDGLEDDVEIARFLGDDEESGDGIEFSRFVEGGSGGDRHGMSVSGSGLEVENADLESEFTELKIGMRQGTGEGQDEQAQEAAQVEDFESLMSQAMAARGAVKLQSIEDVGHADCPIEMSSHLPKEQRRKAAARAINDLMRTM